VNALLGWQSLVFYVPVAFGALLAVGAALGVVGDDGAEGGGDAHEGDGDPSSLLAVGRLPITVRLMLATLSFGGIGLVVTPLLSGASMGGAVAVAIVVASLGTLTIDRVATRWLARRMPLFESQTVRRAELVGAIGRVVLTASARGGVAQVRDGRGDLHQVTCRLAAGEADLPPGAEVLLIDYDERGAVYLGERVPFGLSRRGSGP
jgi:hypothetical protein